MTLLVSWIGRDSHGTTSAYIAADSRITWSDSSESFDFARKVFAFRNSPGIIGYCGDVLFPSMILGQIVEMADNGLLFRKEDAVSIKFGKIVKKIKAARKKYPSLRGIISPFKILYIGRDFSDVHTFKAYTITESETDNNFQVKEHDIPPRSDILLIGGSGKESFIENIKKYKREENGYTSRVVFHCFCRTLFLSGLETIGGAPQLVGLNRKKNDNGLTFGIVRNNQRFFLGSTVVKSETNTNIKWFNQLFERCDGITAKRLAGAQHQPDFLGNHY